MAAVVDSNDVVSKIIQCVKQFPALYDTTHEDYNRYHKKIHIWNNIAAEVNFSDGKVAQTKWRNIRDSYVKHLKSLQSPEPAYKKYRNWQWVDQMSFLRKFLGGNKQKQGGKSDNAETSMIDVVESVYSETATLNDLEMYESSSSTAKMNNGSPVWYNNVNEGPPEQALIPECEYSNYQRDYSDEQPNNVHKGTDATDLLFLSYAKTLKSLSKKRQIRLKMKFSELMGLAELEEENERNVEWNHVDSSENSHEPKAKKRIKREVHSSTPSNTR